MATESWYDFETCCSAEVVKKGAFNLQCAINVLTKEDENYLDLKKKPDTINLDGNLTSEIKSETKAVPTPKVFSFRSSNLTQIVETLTGKSQVYGNSKFETLPKSAFRNTKCFVLCFTFPFLLFLSYNRS